MLSLPLLGRLLLVRGADVDTATWLRMHWEASDAPPPSHRGEIIVDFTEKPRGAERPAAQAVPTEVDGITVVWKRLGERKWATVRGAAGVHLALDAAGARITAWGAAGAPDRRWLAALYVAISEGLRATGLVPMHAAVLARGGRAVALLGNSGLGKSSTLVTALAAGWSPLAEDAAWLDPASWLIHGLDRGVRLTPATARRLTPFVEDVHAPRDARGKVFVDYTSLGVAHAPTAELACIAMLRRDGRRASGWEPASRADAVGSLWQATGLPLCPHNRAFTARTIAQLVTHMDVRRYILGATAPSL